MDNITHTLIGALVGEAVAAATKPAHEGLPRNERRAVFVTAMAIGSNVPDLDVLYSTVTGSKLDYLLHHRGHTHTFAIAVVIAGLLWLACERWAKRRGLRLASADRMTIVALCLLAPVLHVLMDLTNSYGVHPFWPFDNRWLYGDAVFIVEPLLWAAAAPLLFTLRTRIARSLVALALIIGIGLTFFTGFVPLKLAVAYSVLVVALVYASSAFSTRGAIALGIAFWLLVTACYMGTSRIVAREVSELAAASFAQAQALDRVLTPMPVNPLCWEMLLVQREADDELVVRRGMFALRPDWIAATACPNRNLDGPITAPVEPVPLADTPQVAWYGQTRSPLAPLVALWQERCQVDALMRFVRAPWLAQTRAGLVVGDARYDREAELGFAELSLDKDDQRCPRWMPPWQAPRADLLR
jgi:Predicted membrane-bound metal-dependent hydrolases